MMAPVMLCGSGPTPRTGVSRSDGASSGLTWLESKEIESKTR